MIDHVTATVTDVEASKQFYEAALKPLGYSLAMAGEGFAGFSAGKPGESIPDFWLGVRPERGAAHVAFQARDRPSVDAFHAAALAAGGTSNGAPGIREHYHPNYYGAFVHDFDGNNIEAVCHSPE